METANARRLDIGAFLENYIHLTKYSTTEGSLICLFSLQKDISHLPIIMYFGKKEKHKVSYLPEKYCTSASVLFDTEKYNLIEATWQLARLQSAHVMSSQRGPSRTI